ncbi:MAG TPA: repressor LexA [Anaerolineae bacterium]|nr:repressor LexA [Anaerolineae bacterium]HID84599.1 repressor LexA [Anaerolineales bacterium]HIQ08403.1 repressor LexA [Anaerolineaceae bacterium]
MMMARPKRRFPDDKDRRVWAYIVRYYQENGIVPSVRQIQDEVGLSSTSVVKARLERLAEHGCIEYLPPPEKGPSRMARNYRPLPSCSLEPTLTPRGMRMVPLYGPIAAGLPIPRPDGSVPLEEIPVPVDFLPRAYDDLFALQVRGDSMIDAMVNDGDIVILRPATEAHRNEMVAVWLRDREETTLKYYDPVFDAQGHLQAIRLRPAHPHMEPIVIDDPAQVEIKGKVVMVIRRLDRRPLVPPSGKEVPPKAV